MTYRLRHRPRAACRLPGIVPACLAFGSEASCVLCDMIDFRAPITCATVGRYPARDPVEAAEDQFWAHLARRTDGGPVTPWELARRNASRRERSRGDAAAKITAASVRRSPLPVDAPF